MQEDTFLDVFGSDADRSDLHIVGPQLRQLKFSRSSSNASSSAYPSSSNLSCDCIFWDDAGHLGWRSLTWLVMSDKATKTATDTLENPTNAAGALTGKDSALGGLGGGRKPGPANRAENEGAVSKEEEDKSSLKIRIQLDLDVEIHLTARVKGDIVIGLF
ncbi:hypothetical protein BST61_g7070 [Cercospora zeina]